MEQLPLNNTHEKERLSINLEKATPDDVEAYLALEKKLESETYKPFIEASEVLEQLQECSVYVIKVGDQFGGIIAYEREASGSVEISTLAVDPQYQGMGFGRKALEKVLAEIGEVPIIHLLTHPDNKQSVSLYKSLGFQITERIENGLGDGEPRVKMVLER